VWACSAGARSGPSSGRWSAMSTTSTPRPCRAHGPRAEHHVLGALGAIQLDLPPWQLRLPPVRRQKQLGQSTLHRGRLIDAKRGMLPLVWLARSVRGLVIGASHVVLACSNVTENACDW
jgi:hypothetical protein